MEIIESEKKNQNNKDKNKRMKNIISGWKRKPSDKSTMDWNSNIQKHKRKKNNEIKSEQGDNTSQEISTHLESSPIPMSFDEFEFPFYLVMQKKDEKHFTEGK